MPTDVEDQNNKTIETTAPSAKAERVGFLARCWTGQARLWQAFWIVGVLGKFLAFGVIALIALGFFMASKSTLVSDSFALPAMIGYVAFVAVSVWRCAPNTKYAPLHALAKVWVIFYVVGMAISIWNAEMSTRL